mmetsp:Transcript_460/g.1325  ORF Transcript_460/g.1325 Transcript_460/m.1325 type:complete len:178 (+) Transcript_460:2383-2916(+)
MTRRYSKVFAAISGILIVSALITEAILIGKQAFFNIVGNSADVIRWAGAAWIFYLGVRKVLDDEKLRIGSDIKPARSSQAPILRDIVNSVVISITNPKVIVFYLSVYSQYLSPQSSFAKDQVFLVQSVAAIIIAYGTYALVGTFCGRILQRSGREFSLGRISGLCYICIAIYFAFFL